MLFVLVSAHFLLSRARGLDSFTLDGLGRINLLVGTNNSGKTSILECIELLRSAGNPNALATILTRRGEWGYNSSSEERHAYLDVTHLFANHKLSGKCAIEGTSVDTRSRASWNNRVTVDVTDLRNGQLELEQEDSLEEDGQLALRVNWSNAAEEFTARTTTEGLLRWPWAPRLSRFRDDPSQFVQFDGVERDGQWRARIDQGGHTCSVTVQLSGAERGAWKNKTTGKQGSLLLTVIHVGARHGTLAETLALAHKLERELSRKITISQGYGMGL